MSTSPLSCALGLDGEHLSAWRDQQLPPDELRRIAAHVPGCASCARHLAEFDALAVALRRQRELEPGDRVWHGVLARVAERSHGGRGAPDGGQPPRGPWRGLGAVAVVAAVLALFILILGTGRFARQGNPNATATASQSSATATTSATATSTAPIATVAPQPTAPVFTPPQPNVQVTTWAANAKVATVNGTIDATHTFIAQGILPDGKTLLGVLAPAVNDAAGQDHVATMNVATRAVTVIPGMPATIAGFGPPQCCQYDGRFLVATISSAPGATCGICNQMVWYYDTTTGGNARRVPSNGMAQMSLSGGFVAIEDDDDGIEVDNLATGKITQIAPDMTGGGTSVQGGGQFFGLSAPYLFYAPMVNGTNQVLTIHVRDLATGQDSVLTGANSLLKNGGGQQLTMSLHGTTLYFSLIVTSAQGTNGFALYRLPNFAPGDAAAPTAVATPNVDCGQLIGPGDRLFLCRDLDSGYTFYYDRDQGRYVLLPVNGAYYDVPSTAIGGNFLLMQTISASAATVTIYDLSRVPA